MANEDTFNPLDKAQLGESVAQMLAKQPLHQLPLERSFQGAGIYAIYYRGNFGAYRQYEKLVEAGQDTPIYVGKAVPEGSRKGGFGLGAAPGTVLYRRIRHHCRSIEQASNLRVHDFECRYLVVEDIWIPLGEAMMIEQFSPLWNKSLDGFGNNDPGKGRYNQERSAWDTVHPGRPWAAKCKPNSKSAVAFRRHCRSYLTGQLESADAHTSE